MSAEPLAFASSSSTTKPEKETALGRRRKPPRRTVTGPGNEARSRTRSFTLPEDSYRHFPGAPGDPSAAIEDSSTVPPGRFYVTQRFAGKIRRGEPGDQFARRKSGYPGSNGDLRGLPQGQAAGQPREGGIPHPAPQANDFYATSFIGDLPAVDRQRERHPVVQGGQAHVRRMDDRADGREAFAKDHPPRDGPLQILEPIELLLELPVRDQAPEKRPQLSGIGNRQELRMERRIRLHQAEPKRPFPGPDIPGPGRDTLPRSTFPWKEWRSRQPPSG